MSYPGGTPPDAGHQQPYGYGHSYVGAPPQPGAYINGQQQPGVYLQATGYPQMVAVTTTLPPNSYLAWSIISLLFFCMPLGIAALVFSLGVSADYAAGLHVEAHRKSSVARVLNIIATVLGVVLWIVIGVVVGLWVNTYYYIYG